MDTPTTPFQEAAYWLAFNAFRNGATIEAALAEAASYIGKTHWSDEGAYWVHAGWQYATTNPY